MSDYGPFQTRDDRRSQISTRLGTRYGGISDAIDPAHAIVDFGLKK
jgi:hypothetical protein